MKVNSDNLCKIKDEACILLPSKTSLLQLVKPSQLVMQLPSECSLEPYCYRVESSLQKYGDFLMAVGVRQELKAQEYIALLASIKQEIDGNDGHCDRENKVIKILYREVIHCLRQCHPIVPNTVIYLPDKDMTLTDVRELYLSDAEWYRYRLPVDCCCKIIFPPPVDDTGHRTLPEVLKVRKLSEIITEELHEDCKSSDLICLDEELFAVGKRNNSRCIAVQNIISTLKSEELFHGLCRMYFTEYREHPTETYIQLVKRLKEVQVKCLHSDLKTVLHVDGKIIRDTEESGKFCHHCKEGSSMVLYITPHNKKLQANMNPFFKHLALCISKMINNEIKSPLPIAAIFDCEPAEIPQILTKEHVAEYSMDSRKDTGVNSPGSTISWDKLSSKDYLIILNFDAGEPVYYLKEDGSIIYAIVVESFHTNQESVLQFFRPTVTIRVREPENNGQKNGKENTKTSSNVEDDQNSSSENSDSDMVTSDDEYDDNCNDHTDTNKRSLDVSTVTVSPVYVFKLLTVSQRNALWKGDITPFACPLLLPKIPFEDTALFNQWLHDVYTLEMMHGQSGLTLEVLKLRVMKNIVYQLRVDKNEPMLLKTLILKIQNIVQEDIPSYSPKPIGKNDEIMNILSSLMEKLCLDDVTNNDGLSDDSDDQLKLSKLMDEQKLRSESQHCHKSNFSTPYNSVPVKRGRSPIQYPYFRQPVSSPTKGTTPKAEGSSSSSKPPTTGTSSRSWCTSYSKSTFRVGYQGSRSLRNWLQPAVMYSPPMKSQPNTCMKSATAWLEQAKADFNAAGSLLPSLETSQEHESSCMSDVTMETSDDVCNKKCDFPALVCFLCHDTVEKCIKGVLYAFCGLEQGLINCSNLITLHDALASSPHCPSDDSLIASIKESVMTVNRHENRSRFPNYQNTLCAPATIYDTEDAVEAFTAAEKLLHKLQSEEKFQNILQNLHQLPSQKFLSSLKSMSANEGECCCMVIN